jgi:hypothetical protein
MTKVLVALPTYDDTSSTRQHIYLWGAQTDRIQIVPSTRGISALCWCFNWLYTRALNDKTYDYFLLLHADIIPINPPHWVGKMISEADRVGADILSIVSPLKSSEGLTSTALVSDQHPQGRRVTMFECVKQLPETFTDRELIEAFGWQNETHVQIRVNTGCMLLDLRRKRELFEQMHFRTHDNIIKRDGKFVATFIPEDWDFSDQAYKLGLKVAASRVVQLLHHGATDYRNGGAWGTTEHDTEERCSESR